MSFFRLCSLDAKYIIAGDGCTASASCIHSGIQAACTLEPIEHPKNYFHGSNILYRTEVTPGMSAFP